MNNLIASGGGFDFDVFINKLDSTGNYIWAKQIGGTSFEDCKALGVDSKGNIYATGYFSGTADFDPGPASYPLTSAGSDIYIAKLDSAGNFLWAKQSGEAATDNTGFGRGLALDASSNVYTTGSFGGVMDFDPGTGSYSMDAGPLYSDDAFIHKMMCADTTSATVTASTEGCVPYELNGHVYTASGTYVQRIPNAAGCDSIITLILDINDDLHITITNNNLVLQASATYSSYQWLKNNTIIAGATAATYTVTENGDYSLVAATANGCTDTSNVIHINGTGIGDPDYNTRVTVYPNPAGNRIHVAAAVVTNLSLSSIDGKVLKQAKAATTMSLEEIAAGIYFLKVTNTKGHLLKTEKIIREK